MTRPPSPTVIELIGCALRGELTPAALEDEWPGTSAADAFMEAVREDLLDAAEHTPRGWLSSRVDNRRYEKSDIRLTLVLDKALLDVAAPLSADKLQQLRQTVLAAQPTTDGEVHKLVAAALSARDR